MSVDFDAATKKLQKFEKLMGNFNKSEIKATAVKSKMMNQHSKEREKHLNKEYKNKIKRENDLSKAHVAAIKQNIKSDKKAEAERIAARNKPDGMNSHLAVRDKHLTDQHKRKIKRIEEVNKAEIAAYKQNIKFDKQRDKIRNTPFSSPINNAHVKAREADINRRMRNESKRVTNLQSAQDTFGNSKMALDRHKDAAKQAAQSALKEAVAKATTAKEVRRLVAVERQRLRVLKDSERSYKKQNFLMQRMQSSSKQIAGNMVSAFAVSALGAGITRVGQDFESVNNTMLAVSTNSKEAGENFKFVRDESYRLGLGLANSGKNFAKMLSARGNMSLEDTKKAFSGVAEMSTLLGLSADESTRATNALQQMMSKGVVSAEELKLQMGKLCPL